MSIEFPLNAKVRFTQQRLSILTPRDRQNLAGRIGVVQTDCNVVRKPTVYFPAEGAQVELRLFQVDPRQLELVEGPPVTEPEVTPRINESAVDLATPAPDDSGGNLSQNDLDNFFD
jgi:hypothetical protein